MDVCTDKLVLRACRRTFHSNFPSYLMWWCEAAGALVFSKTRNTYKSLKTWKIFRKCISIYSLPIKWTKRASLGSSGMKLKRSVCKTQKKKKKTQPWRNNCICLEKSEFFRKRGRLYGKFIESLSSTMFYKTCFTYVVGLVWPPRKTSSSVVLQNIVGWCFTMFYSFGCRAFRFATNTHLVCAHRSGNCPVLGRGKW